MANRAAVEHLTAATAHAMWKPCQWPPSCPWLCRTLGMCSRCVHARLCPGGSTRWQDLPMASWCPNARVRPAARPPPQPQPEVCAPWRTWPRQCLTMARCSTCTVLVCGLTKHCIKRKPLTPCPRYCPVAPVRYGPVTTVGEGLLDLAVWGKVLAAAAFGAALAPTLFWALSSFQGCASSVGPPARPCVTGCPECDGRG